MPLGLLAITLTAHALTSQQSGPAIDLAAGVGIGDRPVAAMFGGQLSLGWWTGVYDDQYAFGRYWWFGATGRVDARARGARIVPMFEIRRGLELFLAGASIGVAGGAVVETPDTGKGDPVGWTARALVQAKLRRTRFLGISLRIEGGVDQMGALTSFGGGALLGISFARPARAIEDPVLEDLGGGLPVDPVDGSEDQEQRQEGEPDRSLEEGLGVRAAGGHADGAGPGGGRQETERDHR